LNVDSSTGWISGNTSASGTKPVMLTATNAQGSGSKLLLLSVESSSQAAPVITSSPSVSAKAGESFTYQILASNNPTSYAAQNLPQGLSLDTSSGLISGIVTTAGNYTATIQAGNSGGDGTQALSIAISGGTPDPTPAPAPPPSGGNNSGGGGGTSGGGSPPAEKSKQGKKSSSQKKNSAGNSSKTSSSSGSSSSSKKSNAAAKKSSSSGSSATNKADSKKSSAKKAKKNQKKK
jgi:hypothetical protein